MVFAGLAVVVIPLLVLKYLPETKGLEIGGTAVQPTGKQIADISVLTYN